MPIKLNEKMANLHPPALGAALDAGVKVLRHESDLVLREDSLTRATTSLVQLCKPAVKQPSGTSDEKVYDFSVSIERGLYQIVGRPGAPQLATSCRKRSVGSGCLAVKGER